MKHPDRNRSSSRMPAWCFVTGCLLLVSTSLAGAVTDPHLVATPEIVVHTDRDGLPQNSVESMALDDLGQLWAATREGLAVWDGTIWEAISLPESSPSNWVRSVAATSD
ncbi:MAG: hypothetical protein R3338_15850, partial [Thermoanaerobaculia bacterium]|nr:hypothetical protein [Thermoanaerobaculia bacterium]